MKRLNVKLLAWLASTTLVLAVGVHFLHAFQIDRNATVILGQAKTEKEAGNLPEAAKQFTQYLKFRPKDAKVNEEYANLMVQIAERPGHSHSDTKKARDTLEATVRVHPELTKLRRRLVDYLMELSQPYDAMKHIEALRGTDQVDTALDVKRAVCLQKVGNDAAATELLTNLVGYDLKGEKFESEKPPIGLHEWEAYSKLAIILLRPPHSNRPAAEIVINRMVEMNPDSFKAYLERARYFLSFTTADSAEAATKDVSKALELAPDDPDVIVMAAQLKSGAGEFAAARELLKRGIEKNPKNERVYNTMAIVMYTETKKTDEALECLREGLKNLPESELLLQTSADVMLIAGDFKGMSEIIKAMEREGNMAVLVSYFRARTLIHEKHWLLAARQFERLRPAMARHPDYLARINLALSECYSNLGEWDRALEASTRVYNADQNSIPALLAMANSLMQMQKVEQARKYLEKVNELRHGRADENSEIDDNNNFFRVTLAKELNKPKKDRDWAAVEKASEPLLKNPQLSDLQRASLKIELAIMKEDWDGARAEVMAALKTHPKEVSLWLTRLSVYDRKPLPPAENPEAAKEAAATKYKNSLEILDRAQKAAGDVVAFRTARANLISRPKDAALDDKKGPEDALAELAKLEEGIDDAKFSADDQAAFWNAQGAAYFRLHDYPGTRRCWLHVVEKRPDDLTIREALFTVALENNKEKDAEASLNDIRKAAGSDSALYLYCVAARSFNKIQRELHLKRGMEKAEAAEIETARAALTEAVRLRPTWYEAKRLAGKFDDLQGKYDSAIENYQSALDLGPPDGAVSRRLVQLLYQQGRSDEVTGMIEKMGTLASTDPLNRFKMAVDLKGDAAGREDALELARQAVADDPENAGNHIVLAKVLLQLDRPDDAEAQMRIATEKAPKSPEPWLMLLMHLKRQSKGPEEAKVIEDAKKNLPEEIAPAVLGPAFEVTGDWIAAERHYLDAEKLHPKEIAYLRTLASFYMRAYEHEQAQAASEPRKSAVADHQKHAATYHAQAMDYLGKILKSGKGADDQSTVLWARRAKAKVLAGEGGYQNVQAAMHLIEQNAVGGVLSPEDMTLEADLLSSRFDIVSRKRAIELYEALDSKEARSKLTPQQQLVLAELYDRVGRWPEARSKMIDLVTNSKHPEQLWVSLISMYLEHDELSDAAQTLKQLTASNNAAVEHARSLDKDTTTKDASTAELNRLTPLLGSTNELHARLLAKQGKGEDAEKLVNKIITDKTPAGLESAGKLLESMGLDAAAEKKFRSAADLEPRKKLALAGFLGRHDGKLDEVFALYEDSKLDWPFATIADSAIQTLDARKTEVTPKLYKFTADLVDKGLAENDEHSQELQVQQCQLLELQGRYKEVLPVYRAIVANPKFDPGQQARVKNNLAYLLATGSIASAKKDDVPEALKLINETIDLLGPTSDVLDTRAVTYIANDQFKEAATDARAALLENANPLKYFHLALAEYRSGKRGPAREALQFAKDMKLDSQIVPIERPVYKQLMQELFPDEKK